MDDPEEAMFLFLGWFGRAVAGIDFGDEAKNEELGDILLKGFVYLLQAVAKGELTPKEVALRFTFMMEEDETDRLIAATMP